jgi:hypothetical protein
LGSTLAHAERYLREEIMETWAGPKFFNDFSRAYARARKGQSMTDGFSG